MNIIKKTMLAGLAAVTLAATGAAFTASNAQAGYHYSGGYNFPVCSWRWVWKTNYYGKRYRVRVRVCH